MKILKNNKMYENHENLCKTLEVVRGQEASLESSKRFYRGSRSYLNRRAWFCQVVSIPALGILEIYDFVRKYLEISRNPTKINENEKLFESMETMKICENLSKSMKYNTSVL